MRSSKTQIKPPSNKKENENEVGDVENSIDITKYMQNVITL